MANNATANAYIEEPIGKIDTKEERDSIWQSIFNLGKLRNFNQAANLTWTIPINKIPMLDWVTASAGYNTNYRWEGATNATQQLGNTIENSNTKTIRGQVDFVRLYNKIPLLKAINTPRRTTPTRPQANRPGQQQQPQPSNNTPIWETLYRGFFRALMGFRNAGIEYQTTEGILLPGFMGTPTILGTNFNTNMPGLPFAFGSTRDIRDDAVRLNLMSKDSLQNYPYMEKFSKSISANALFEPFSELRVQFNALLTSAESHSEYFKYNATEQKFGRFSPQMSGNYNVSIIAWKTAFSKDNNLRENPIFETFLEYRETIAKRLAENNPHSLGHDNIYDTLSGRLYPHGYGPTAQEVLIPAFIAAYTGKSAAGITTSPFLSFPLPNWQITYVGLSKVKFLQKWFTNISCLGIVTTTG